jgi:hypothetical protein
VIRVSSGATELAAFAIGEAQEGIVTLTGPISRALVLSISDEQSFLSSSPLSH